MPLRKINGIVPHESLTEDRIIEAAYEDNNIGFCITCGEEAYGVEPDAERYRCENCGALQVYGVDELLLRIFCFILASQVITLLIDHADELL